MNKKSIVNKKSILEFVSEIHSINDIQILLDIILNQLIDLTHAEGGSIFLKEGATKLRCHSLQDRSLFQKENSEKIVYNYFHTHDINIDNLSIVGYVAKTKKNLMIKDVYKISNKAPYRFNAEFDKKFSYRTKSILAVPLLNTKKEILGVLELINARNRKNHIINFNKKSLMYVNFFSDFISHIFEKAIIMEESVNKLLKLAEMRDPQETGSHVKRVGFYAIEIYQHWAKKKGKAENEIRKFKDLLRIASMCHDIGKVAISDIILKKKGRLTTEEFNEVKQHTIEGANLFSQSIYEIDKLTFDVCISHHEKWNGTGYPKGLRGNEIPLAGQIVSIADVYDALISDRVYKKSWGDQKTLDYMEAQRGKHFSPLVLDSFFAIYDITKAIRNRYQ